MSEEEKVDVDAILSTRQSQYKSIQVDKDVDVELDIGNLLATDTNVLKSDELKKNTDEYLLQVARDNVQILINEIWKLPTDKKEDVVLAELPPPKTILPREKPIPKPKVPTKWELFAKEKGIKKKKRTRMVFDEKAQEWKPRYGYKRINDPKEDWVMEVPQNADQFEDQFEKRSKEKEERIAKNEYQRLRNLARNKKGKVKVSIPPADKSWNKEQLTKALTIAKSSTASVGKFTSSLPSEPVAKNTGKKRQYLPVTGNAKEEKQRNLDILEKLSKPPVLDVTKAVNKKVAEEQQQIHLKRKATEQSGGKKKKQKKSGKKSLQRKPAMKKGGKNKKQFTKKH